MKKDEGGEVIITKGARDAYIWHPHFIGFLKNFI
jgi:hypothetical protein